MAPLLLVGLWLYLCPTGETNRKIEGNDEVPLGKLKMCVFSPPPGIEYCFGSDYQPPKYMAYNEEKNKISLGETLRQPSKGSLEEPYKAQVLFLDDVHRPLNLCPRRDEEGVYYHIEDSKEHRAHNTFDRPVHLCPHKCNQRSIHYHLENSEEHSFHKRLQVEYPQKPYGVNKFGKIQIMGSNRPPRLYPCDSREHRHYHIQDSREYDPYASIEVQVVKLSNKFRYSSKKTKVDNRKKRKLRSGKGEKLKWKKSRLQLKNSNGRVNET